MTFRFFIFLFLVQFFCTLYAHSDELINHQNINSINNTTMPFGDSCLEPSSIIGENGLSNSSFLMTSPEYPEVGSGEPGFYDTSLYLIGKIVVSVFFEPGADGPWDPSEIDASFQQIVDSVNQIIEWEPNANLEFVFVKEVDSMGTPIPAMVSHIAAREYINHLRSANMADWGFIIQVRNETSSFAGALLHGPFVLVPKIFNSFSISTENTIRHEIMHIFGAVDQYVAAGQSPINRWGYLDTVNANSWFNNGLGFHSGAGEGRPDVMVNSSTIMTPYTRGQIGWRDNDGDGILDPVDTIPETVIEEVTGNQSFHFKGLAYDKPLPLSNSYGSGLKTSVTINKIKRIEYRINQGAWSRIEPIDGVYDSRREKFEFTTPPLKKGEYIVEVRAINSVGNVETSHAIERFRVFDSEIANNPPIGSFSLTPPFGSVYTNFKFDASNSANIGPDQNLQYRWDFDGDGVWDTVFSPESITYHQYLTDGAYAARLEVKNGSGLTHISNQSILVSHFNQPPIAKFTVSPENAHGNPLVFPIKMDASDSFDGETDTSLLQVRWDFENDGIWDTPFSSNKTIEHTYPLDVFWIPILPIVFDLTWGWKIKMEIIDTNGQSSFAYRDVWTVMYNHAPKKGHIEVEYSDRRIDAKCEGFVDEDYQTTWDGLLEYRWDFDGDGAWDTKYSSSTTFNDIPIYKDLHHGQNIICEARDRFQSKSQAFHRISHSDLIITSGINIYRAVEGYIETAEVYIDSETTLSFLGDSEVNARGSCFLGSLRPLPISNVFELGIDWYLEEDYIQLLTDEFQSGLIFRSYIPEELLTQYENLAVQCVAYGQDYQPLGSKVLAIEFVGR